MEMVGFVSVWVLSIAGLLALGYLAFLGARRLDDLKARGLEHERIEHGIARREP